MIYLDHCATTPLDPRVLEAMLPHLTGLSANPSAQYSIGREAQAAIEKARKTIADLFGCAPKEVIFTSGGTEANHLAIQGSLRSGQLKGRHIVIGGIEHSAVTKAARAMEREGYEVTLTDVTEHGEVTPDAVRAALRPDTALVSVMHAQNEVGTVNRIQEIAEMLGHKRILFHCDAAQSIGKVPTVYHFMGAELLSIAAHKFYGPRGVGALIAANYVQLDPLFKGGLQEGLRRAGTENTAGIIGLAKALELCQGSALQEYGETVTALRDYAQMRLAEELRGVMLNGHVKNRLPGTLNVSVLGISGKALAQSVEGVAFSTGSACHDSLCAPSEIILSMGLPYDRAKGAIRLAFGRTNTVSEVDEAVAAIVARARALRAEAGVEESSLPESSWPRCPRCNLALDLMSTSGGMLVKCADYEQGCNHLLPLPGTRPPE